MVWKGAPPRGMNTLHPLCPLVEGSECIPVDWMDYNFDEERPSFQAISGVRQMIGEWLRRCLRCGEFHWPLDPLPESCCRSVSHARGLPACFRKADGEMMNPSRLADNEEFVQMRHTEHYIRRFVAGDWMTVSFLFTIRARQPHLQGLVPIIGTMHEWFNCIEGIRDLEGEPLLWPCALHIGWAGLQHTATCWQKLEDLVVLITCACVDALHVLGVRDDDIFTQCDTLMSSQVMDVHMKHLVFFVNYLGGQFILTRALGSAGRSVSWMAVYSTLHKFYVVAGMPNYASLHRKIMRLLLQAGLSIQDLNVIFSSMFLRLNQFNIKCTSLDDVSKQVWSAICLLSPFSSARRLPSTAQWPPSTALMGIHICSSFWRSSSGRDQGKRWSLSFLSGCGQRGTRHGQQRRC